MPVQREEELVRACARGEPGAWEEFVEGHASWLSRVIRATLKRHAGAANEADADDVLADVYRQMLERDRALLKSFRAPFNLRAWLAVIARRACLRLLRKKPPPAPTPLPPAPREDTELLKNLLNELPAEDRLLLELFFIHERSYGDIAGALGLAVDSIGKRKFRALQKLRDLVRGRGREDFPEIS